MSSPAINLTKAANKRGVARLAAVQALYQMDLTSAAISDVVEEFESFRLGKEFDGEAGSDKYREADADWFKSILNGVVNEQGKIDPLIHHNLPADWPLKRIETLLRSILRAGVWELKQKSDVPARVIINEYVDVAKAFYESSEPKMVNGLLDRLARTLREDELLSDKEDADAAITSNAEIAESEDAKSDQ